MGSFVRAEFCARGKALFSKVHIINKFSFVRLYNSILEIGFLNPALDKDLRQCTEGRRKALSQISLDYSNHFKKIFLMKYNILN